MSQPAARLGDMMVHGGNITVGCPTVLIGGKPASRIGDMHTCPMVTGMVPHVGGPIILGSFNVLIGGPPAARQGDMAICIGPPDSIAMGEPTVLIGMAGLGGFGGLLGALLGGALAGIKNFLSGYPRAVRRPDGSYVTEYNKSITIEGSPEYQATVISDLNHLKTLPTGQRLFQAIDDTGRHSTIRPIAAGQSQDNGFCSPTNYADSLVRRDATGNITGSGPGSDSIIGYNPSYGHDYRAEDGSLATQQPHQILGHEMMHALHNGQGNNRREMKDPMDPDDNQEEAQTIGVHGYEGERISERNLGGDEELPARPNHNAVESWRYQDTNGQWYEGSYGAAGNIVANPIPAPNNRPNH